MINEDIYALSLIKGIGNKSLLQIIKTCETIDELTSMGEEALKKMIKGKGAFEATQELQNNFDSYREKAEYELDKFSENNIKVISYTDHLYPDLYKKISTPPVFLYCKGNLELLQHDKSIAVIGTRECSDIGYKIAKKTASFFSKKGFNIVSGLAIGIDTAGHEGALEAGGVTTAILVDVEKIYPKQNRELAERILRNDGLLIAENKPGFYSGKGAFVSRDRLQSALSLAIFPIETDIKGGTMHTVKFAKEQDRLIFCPDISKLKNWYDPGFTKIRGIESLLASRDAFPYSESDYDTVLNMLEKKRTMFFNKPKEQSEEDINIGLFSQKKYDL